MKSIFFPAHVNYPFMIKHLERSRDLFLENQAQGFHLGVELITLPNSQYDFALKYPSDFDCCDKWLHGYISRCFMLILLFSSIKINQIDLKKKFRVRIFDWAEDSDSFLYSNTESKYKNNSEMKVFVSFSVWIYRKDFLIK